MSQASTAKQALERAAKDKMRVRIFYGDPVTGKDNCDETERIGVPLKTKGGAYIFVIRKKDKTHNAWIHTIDSEQVVRIVSYTHGSKSGKPSELYRHPSYTTGEWSSYYRHDLGKWVAVRNGLIHATFDSEIDAAIYTDYIQGNRARTRGPDKVASFKRLLKRTSKP